jgi:5'-nucleotidase
MSRPSTRRTAAGFGTIALIGSVLVAVPAIATENEDGTVTIDLAGITDLHGHIENAPLLATALNEIREENPDGTLFLSAGDNIGGSAFVSAIAEDVPTLDVLDAMELDYSAVGNHEFDKGVADLTDRVIPLIEFPYLGANVDGDPAAPINDPAYRIQEVEGVSVAIIGTVTDETPSIVSAGGVEGLTFVEEVGRANEVAAQLSDGDESNGEADVVVALVHADAQGVAAGLSEDVDAAFAGHSHLDQVLTTASGAPVVQADHYGQVLGHIELTVDPETGEITTDTAENIPMYGPEDEQGNQPELFERDADIEAMYQEALEESDVLGAEPVGTVGGPIDRAARDGAGNGSNRGAESTFGNLLGDVALFASDQLDLGADIGVINPGGIRADLDPNGDGTVTFAEAFTAQPFGNTIGVVTITGERLHLLLEQQIRNATGEHPYLALGWSENFDYVFDPSAPAGEQILYMAIDGEPVADDQEVTIAGNTFLLAGGDSFSAFCEDPEAEDCVNDITETGKPDVESLNEYIQANEGIEPNYAQRSIGWTGALEAEAGETVEVTISGLSMSGVTTRAPPRSRCDWATRSSVRRPTSTTPAPTATTTRVSPRSSWRSPRTPQPASRTSPWSRARPNRPCRSRSARARPSPRRRSPAPPTSSTTGGDRSPTSPSRSAARPTRCSWATGTATARTRSACAAATRSTCRTRSPAATPRSS